MTMMTMTHYDWELQVDLMQAVALLSLLQILQLHLDCNLVVDQMVMAEALLLPFLVIFLFVVISSFFY